jgi:HSP20 family protein
MEDKAMLPMITRTLSPFITSGFFDDDLFPVLGNGNKSLPAVNVKETDKSYILELAVPGIDKNNLKIDMNEDVLTISSQVKTENEQENDGYMRREFSFDSFTRSFYVPENVNKEKIGATYRDGILSVEMPKEEEKGKISKQIMIS